MSLLQHKTLNGWPLFFLIAAFTCAGIIAGMILIGISTPEATVSMIRLSVQFASPWVFIAFVTSPLAQLFPGSTSKWLSRNRRYFGLSFAAGFGWQAVFIAVLLTLYPAYYWEELHNATDLFLRMVSYIFLLALTVTSFFPVRRKMRPEHWRRLHLVGIWYFWLAIWASYAPAALSSDAKTIHIVYTALGLLVLVLRIVAYLKIRSGHLRERA
jgi:sulfoxide reductase heme-binding subunit YedZ